MSKVQKSKEVTRISKNYPPQTPRLVAHFLAALKDINAGFPM